MTNIFMLIYVVHFNSHLKMTSGRSKRRDFLSLVFIIKYEFFLTSNIVMILLFLSYYNAKTLAFCYQEWPLISHCFFF